MLPTISERRLHEAPYASRHQLHQGDDDRRDWRYATAPSARPVYAYDDATAQGGQPAAPLPPLRSTLSYRDDDAWAQRLPPPPAPTESHTRPRLDLFSHLPLSSSSRVRTADDHGAMEDDDQEDDRYYQHRGMASHHAQHPHEQHQTMRHNDAFMGGHGSSANGGGAAASAAAAAAAKRRSRRMSNSERGKLYRSRRKEYVETLEDQVEALKQQLEEMRVKAHGGASDQPARPASPFDTLALSRDRSRAGLARIVCEYFSLFQYGVPVSPSNGAGAPDLSQLQLGSPSQAIQISQSPRLQSFIQTLVDPNMRFGENFGVQMLLEQWQRYSAYHSSLQFDLNSIEVVSHEASPLISATATLRVRFTRTTIEKVFPHVLWNEALVKRLVGLEVEYPVGNKFYFGPDGKIKRYETEVDFVSAFVKALGNVHDAMQLVGSARIKEHHRIGDDGDNGADEATAAHAYGTSGSHSPAGSQGSSSRGSVHSQSHSPELSAAEPPMRPRFKQSEARKTEEVYGEYSPQSTTTRFPSEPRVAQAYYDENSAPRPYARAAGEPGFHHHYHESYVTGGERNPHDHHARRPFERDHYDRSASANMSDHSSSQRRDAGRYE